MEGKRILRLMDRTLKAIEAEVGLSVKEKEVVVGQFHQRMWEGD